MNIKEELQKAVDEILNTKEKDLKIPQLIIDIALSIEYSILKCDVCADKDDVDAKIYSIKNILQIMDRSKWDWEYYTLKSISNLLEKL